MKKSICAFVLLLLFSTPCFAARMFITTVRETTKEQVQDVAVEYMTGKNFMIEELSPYKLIFSKSFGDNFFGKYTADIQINLVERDGNVKIMASNFVSDGNVKAHRGIDKIAPLIKDIRHQIDGTPLDQITNEAVNQLPGSGNVREKKLGLTIGDKDADGKYIVTGIESGSFAANAKLAVGDVIMEINGRPTNEMDKQAIDNYIANKWGSGSSIMIVYEREGKMDIVSLKKNPTTGTESN